MTSEKTLFVVDDDPAVRSAVIALADSMGLRVLAFASAEEFLQQHSKTDRGCIVTDLRMLGMSGLDLQKKLAKKGGTMPLILMTAFADVHVAVDAMTHGAVTVLEKPCRDQELWDSIHKALEIDEESYGRIRRRDEMHDRLGSLTLQERTVLELIVSGTPNKAIANRLELGMRTVESRRANLMKKLDVFSVAELVQLVVDLEEA